MQKDSTKAKHAWKCHAISLYTIIYNFLLSCNSSCVCAYISPSSSLLSLAQVQKVSPMLLKSCLRFPGCEQAETTHAYWFCWFVLFESFSGEGDPLTGPKAKAALSCQRVILLVNSWILVQVKLMMESCLLRRPHHDHIVLPTKCHAPFPTSQNCFPRGMQVSPIKIVKNPDGSLQRAAMTQSALSKERRELREQQQRTLLEAIPKDLSRPWEDPLPEQVTHSGYHPDAWHCPRLLGQQVVKKAVKVMC